MALRVGHEKLHRETGWMPQVSWEDGVLQTIRWYAENRERWIGRVDWLMHRHADAPARDVVTPMRSSQAAAASSARTSSSGSRQTARRRRRARAARLRPHDDGRRRAALRRRRARSSSSISPPRSAASAPTGPIPGRYWYANLMMGAHVLEQARLHGTPQARRRRHRLRVPEVHARAVPRGRPLERLPGGDERAVRRREEGVLVGAQAYREQYGPNAIFLLPDQPLRAARQLRPDERARDPRPDPEDGRVAASEVDRSGATARRRASSSTSTTASRGSSSPPSATTAPDPVNLGTGVEIVDPRPGRARRGRGRVRGRIDWDTSMPNGQPRRSSTRPAPRSSSASRRACRSTRASSAPSLVPRAQAQPLRRPNRLARRHRRHAVARARPAVAIVATHAGSVYGDPTAARATVDTAHRVATGGIPAAGGPGYPLLLAPIAAVTPRRLHCRVDPDDGQHPRSRAARELLPARGRPVESPGGSSRSRPPPSGCCCRSSPCHSSCRSTTTRTCDHVLPAFVRAHAPARTTSRWCCSLVAAFARASAPRPAPVPHVPALAAGLAAAAGDRVSSPVAAGVARRDRARARRRPSPPRRRLRRSLAS